MVATIAPAVSAGRSESWRRTATAFLSGGMAGGAAVGALLGIAGDAARRNLAVPSGGIQLLVAVSALGYALHELGMIRLPVLRLQRQVPRGLRARAPLPFAAFIYSLDLGSGVLTRSVTTLLYVLLIAVASTGNPLFSAALMACFGLARSATTLGLSVGPTSFAALDVRTSSIAAWQPATRTLGGLTLIVVSATFGLHAVVALRLLGG